MLEAPVRIDRWLTAARVYKSRTIAQTACEAGHVRINGEQVRASRAVKIGDEVRALAPRGNVILVVKGLADKRLSAPLAQLLYEDHSPPPPPKEERVRAARTRQRQTDQGGPARAHEVARALRRALTKLRGR
jgi:ribosome-associated heat shock protein Hsp15